MEKKLNKKDLINIFIRSNFLLGSFNFERMQAIGFCVSLLPALRKVYKDDKPAMAAAMKRHLEFFNTQPFLATPIMGITAAMEEKKANGADISDQTISGVKVGLMGPLAGVGDPIFWGTLRPVLAALGAGIALTGSIMGPLIFFLVFNAIRLATNWYGVMYGYSKGTELVDEMGGNKMRFLTEGSSVLGLLVMGALVAKWTTVNMPLVLSSYTNSAGEQVTTTVQTILDSLMPGIVPLLMTFACMWLLRKNVNPLIIILGLFALGIVGYAIGLFA
ncbi:MAG: PTS mannose transporter subunit IID [Mitsuokella jalaludinii]|uniref:PTS system mannose-specific EIID component n=2 Tax=Mitsuokella jalaludinii TaxID=187979 RepID=A0A173WJT4_9FIRM|nr:PTS mannose transporter subunit IID [Mitsuokella jalaludinii]MCI7185094.1 PTS mannose transporter subunit IID [Mitsuokella jalaludinii]MCQ1532263.1 PTS mannose transporter subunit IID [Mitsuokella jalaludinii]CUN39226.1 PTS system mannose-specific EIID component [Mitsuokella jalaludinii]